ncbi:glycosyltransferase family 4 protein [Pseudaquabacterium pictum]|uniref:Glycosyl transferase n=1 Tax=Pseudaquabacterium pictum TaxID=2315236 RepID=A0A480ATE2_9BURK|nr:glycosyltransferase family 4 protein [Rubrivivax pictus]GCL63487.1 glycosyl transferase [Rubrivivax pictus]
MTRPLRIAVVANTAWYLVNFRLNLMTALRAAGHEVVAIAPDDPPQVSRIRAAGLPFEPVPISGAGTNPARELATVLRLWRCLRARQCDLVFSYTPKGNLYSALACIASGRRFVPNVSGLGRAFIRPSFITRVVKLLYRSTFGRAEHVFFQNQDDLDGFVQAGLVPARLCERLPGSGVDLQRFMPSAPPERPAQAPVFLLVARMLWDKGVGEFVDAARQVRRRHPQASFQLLGPADVANPAAIPRQQLADWDAEGVVRYLGPTDDVRPWLAQADCVVLPSYREGVPRTLLEAAACARPVITTDAPGCRDTVRDGQTGWLCRTADADDLADRLLRFIDLPLPQRAAMGAAGRAFVEQHFDERQVIDRYLALAGG